MHASVFGRGTALNVNVDCGTYDADELKDVPYVTAAAVDNGNGELTVFAMNRSLDEDAVVDADLAGFEGYTLQEHIELNCDDFKAVNSLENPDNVVPNNKDIGETITFAAHSWNVLRFKKV